MARDQELDELERMLKMPLPEEHDPAVLKPDKHVLTDGSTCWRDKTRVCGGDCVAFNFVQYGVQPLDPMQGYQQCMLIMIRIPEYSPSRAKQNIPDPSAERRLAEDRLREETLRDLAPGKKP